MKKVNYHGLSVRRVKRLSFYVNESLVKPETIFQPEFGLQFGFSVDANLLDFTVDANLIYPDTKESLARTAVQNLYELQDLGKYVANGVINIPAELITTLVAMSISHTRALFAADLSGTKLNDNPLPIVDAEEMARHFFPLMFEKEIAAAPLPRKR